MKINNHKLFSWRLYYIIIITILLFIAPISNVLAVPVPTATINLPTTQLIGENFTLTVTFNNVGANTGYAPFIDVVLPSAGIDGDDGITFDDATYLSLPLNAIVQTFPASGCINHPFVVDSNNAPQQVCGRTGDQHIIIELPFGSYSPNQPPLDVEINATMSPNADVGALLRVFARGGFRFGGDPLNNPCCDPPLVSPVTPNSGSWPSTPITPVVFNTEKDYLGPADEQVAGITDIPDETVTGVNANDGPTPVQYEMIVDIADGQTLSNVNVTDLLPAGMLFDALVSVTPAGSTPAGGDPIAPNTNLVITWASPISGTTANDDIRIVIQVIMDNITTNGVPVNITNQHDVTADWQPTDPRDSQQALATAGNSAPIVIARALALQKSSTVVGGSTALPGGRLRYRLDFQISDYFVFDDIVLTDVLSDGLNFDPATALLTAQGGGVNITNAPIAPANITTTPNFDGLGSTQIVFRVSDQIGGAGRLAGGCIDPINGTPNPDCLSFDAGALTQGFITFEVDINDVFSQVHLPGNGGSGDASIDQGDFVQNLADISGRSLNTDTFVPLGNTITDNSIRTLFIDRGVPIKSIYAFNGVVCPAQNCTNLEVEAGDTLTYRIQYDTLTTDFENLVFTDFLPLPVFDVNDPDADGVPGPAMTFNPVVNGVPPVAGIAQFGPTDTSNSYAPPGLFSTNPANNSIIFNYGTFDDPANNSSTIDLLFTVTTTTNPFADGLQMANQVTAGEGSTNGGNDRADAIASFELFEPLLSIRKGVIATTNPDAEFTQSTTGPVNFTQPGSNGVRWTGVINSDGLDTVDMNSDVSGLDPNDIVTFAIVIENTGSATRGAFDVRIRDILPAGFSIPDSGLNLTVTRGDGTGVGFTAIGGGLFDPAGGIELIDPNANEGVCRAYDPSTGENIVVLTYDLRVDSGVSIPSALQNTSQLTQYANRDGSGSARNFVDSREGNSYSDRATTIIGIFTDGSSFLDQVTELPSTGDSPMSVWHRRMLLVIMGLLVAFVIQIVSKVRSQFIVRKP